MENISRDMSDYFIKIEEEVIKGPNRLNRGNHVFQFLVNWGYIVDETKKRVKNGKY